MMRYLVLVMITAVGMQPAAWAQSPTVSPVMGLGGAQVVEIRKPRDLSELRNIRDPFKRPLLQEKQERARSELELIPVSDFTMVGILTGPKKTRAILRSNAGKVFVVSDGTRIGTMNGFIRKIQEDRVIVHETVVDVLGEKEIVTQEIRLAEKKKVGSEGIQKAAATETPSGASSESLVDPPSPHRPPLPGNVAPVGAGLADPVSGIMGNLPKPLKDMVQGIQNLKPGAPGGVTDASRIQSGVPGAMTYPSGAPAQASQPGGVSQ